MGCDPNELAVSLKSGNLSTRYELEANLQTLDILLTSYRFKYNRDERQDVQTNRRRDYTNEQSSSRINNIQSSTGGRNNRRTKRCYICGSDKHLKRNCDKR